MSKELTSKLEVIRKKAVHLVEANHKLLAKNEALEQEVKKWKQKLEAELAKTGELNNKIKIIKLAQNIDSSDSGSRDISELKKQLNEYIKEIDNCITMLNE